MAWLSGWGYRKSHVVSQTSGAGTGYQVPITAYTDRKTYFQSLSSNSVTISGNPTLRHTFCPVHNTNIIACNLTIDGSSRTYLAYDSDPNGTQIRLYYSNDLTGAWTAYSGNPILTGAGQHYRWPSVALVGGTLHMFMQDRTDGNLERWTSTDGITFTFQETIRNGGNIDKNPFIWLNPNDSNWYLYSHDNSGADEQIKVRHASSITSLAAASDSVILQFTGVLAAPTVAYIDGRYYLLVEKFPSGWSVDAYYSSSPDTGFTVCVNSPVLPGSNDEACPILLGNPAGTTYYLFTSVDDPNWYAWTRTLTSWPDNTVDLETHAQADYDDIRFTTDDGETLLDHWLEESNANYATVWVEVTGNLTSGNVTIYLYYGNAGASSASNGVNTFVFFDDFAGTFTDKWTVVSGTWSNSAGICTGSVTALGQRARATGVTIGDHAIHTKLRWNSGTYVGIGIAARGTSGDEQNNCFWSGMNAYDVLNHRISEIVTGTQTDIVTQAGMPVTGTWYKITFKLYSTGLRATTSRVSGELSTTDNSFSSGTLCLLNWEASTENVSFDDLFVRKYIYPEPVQSTWGAQETMPDLLIAVTDTAYYQVQSVRIVG